MPPQRVPHAHRVVHNAFRSLEAPHQHTAELPVSLRVPVLVFSRVRTEYRRPPMVFYVNTSHPPSP